MFAKSRVAPRGSRGCMGDTVDEGGGKDYFGRKDKERQLARKLIGHLAVFETISLLLHVVSSHGFLFFQPTQLETIIILDSLVCLGSCLKTIVPFMKITLV